MIHIAEEVYAGLNQQIERAAGEMTDGYKEVEFVEDLVTIKVGLSSNTSSTRFTDYAWGIPQSFIERVWRCEVEMISVTVTDDDGKPTEHDFDAENIEGLYESIQWD